MNEHNILKSTISDGKLFHTLVLHASFYKNTQLRQNSNSKSNLQMIAKIKKQNMLTNQILDYKTFRLSKVTRI